MALRRSVAFVIIFVLMSVAGLLVLHMHTQSSQRAREVDQWEAEYKAAMPFSPTVPLETESKVQQMWTTASVGAQTCQLVAAGEVGARVFEDHATAAKHADYSAVLEAMDSGRMPLLNLNHTSATLGFDNVYVLNRALRPERLVNFLQQAQKMGVRAQVHYGIEAEELNMDAEWLRRWISKCPLDKVRPVQLAVSLSHMEAMQDMLRRGYRTALIVEDDTEFLADFALDGGFARRLAPLQFDWNWDLLMLMRAPLYQGSDSAYAHGILRTQPAWGSNAYVVTRRGAMKLLHDLQFWRANIDVRMADIIRTDPEFVALALDPPGAESKKYGYSDTTRGRR